MLEYSVTGAGTAEDLLVDLGDRLADRLLDGLVSVSSVASRLAIARGISSTAIRLACSPACWPPMPSATMKQRSDGLAAVIARIVELAAVGSAVVTDRDAAGDVVVVLVVLAVVADRPRPRRPGA